MADVTAAPFPVNINGVDCLMSPLTDKDIETLDNQMRGEIVQIARDSIPPGTSKEDREEILLIALREARGVGVLSGGLDQFSREKQWKFMVRLFYLGIAKNSPCVSLEEMYKACKDPGVLSYVQTVWSELNIGDLKKTHDASGGAPAGAPKRRPTTRARSTSTDT